MTTAGNSGSLTTISGSTSRAKDRNAQSIAVSAGLALGEVIRTTLGPKGLDKLLVGSNGMLVVTNDGASILDRMEVDNPVAELCIDLAARQDAYAGDGTTTAVVLAAELLSEAESLFDRGLHPTTVVDGYHRAAQRAAETLERDSLRVDSDDVDRLREIARTVITGKWDEEGTAFLADRAVETVRAIAEGREVDFERITRKTAPGGSVHDSHVVDGLLIDMNESSTSAVSPAVDRPQRVDDATVALIDDQLTIDTATGQGTVTLDSPDQLDAFRRYEDEVYDRQVAAIADAGADVVFCQQSIDEPVRYLLARNGILAVERTRRDELHKLKRATGAAQVASTDELGPEHTGRAAVVERRSVGSREFTVVRGDADAEQVSMLIRGGTEHVVEETKRVLDDCFHVLRYAVEEGEVVPGGGASEVRVARTIRTAAREVAGREQLAMEAFADAIEVVPRTLAETAGLDPVDTLLELRARHHDGERTAGLLFGDADSADPADRVGDVVERGVLEPLAVKRGAIARATEVAAVLLRVDDFLETTRKAGSHEGEHDHDHGSSGLVESTEGYPWAVGHSMSHDH